MSFFKQNIGIFLTFNSVVHSLHNLGQMCDTAAFNKNNMCKHCFVVPTHCGIWLQMRSGPEKEELDMIRTMMKIMRKMAMLPARGLFFLWAVKLG